ncbi:acyl carrier protein [Flagellimonas oceanensis]|uniref:acyl carrier protein n=1 Tax=Flagellimonas oceanensis TaxID=2499163 RepID=UPI000F8C87B6|nr:acyl carrier protein [Allomuricauda oceanensis]
MEKETIMADLRGIFIETLGHESFELNDDTSAKDVDGWDSVTHMMLINEIEEKYDIKFSLVELMGLENISDLIKIILEKKN